MFNLEKATAREIDDEFLRIAEIMVFQKDTAILCSMIDHNTKKEVIETWHND